MKTRRLHILGLHNPTACPYTSRSVKTIMAQNKANPDQISVVDLASITSADAMKNGKEVTINNFIEFAKKKIKETINTENESKEMTDSKLFEVNFVIDFNLGFSQLDINSAQAIHDALSKEFPNVAFNYLLVGGGGNSYDQPTPISAGTIKSIQADGRLKLIDKTKLAKGQYEVAFNESLKKSVKKPAQAEIAVAVAVSDADVDVQPRRPSGLILGGIFSPKAGNPGDHLASPLPSPSFFHIAASPGGSESSVTSVESCLSPLVISPAISPVTSPSSR